MAVPHTRTLTFTFSLTLKVTHTQRNCGVIAAAPTVCTHVLIHVLTFTFTFTFTQDRGRWEVAYPIVGVNLYDGHNGVRNVTFVNFTDTHVPSALPGLIRNAALAQVHYSSPWMLHPQQFASNCRFIGVSHRVWIRSAASFTAVRFQRSHSGVSYLHVWLLSFLIWGATASICMAEAPMSSGAMHAHALLAELRATTYVHALLRLHV